jgi:hypothetical protein
VTVTADVEYAVHDHEVRAREDGCCTASTGLDHAAVLGAVQALRFAPPARRPFGALTAPPRDDVRQLRDGRQFVARFVKNRY